MNTVPKTIKEIIHQSSLPFTIHQSHSFDGIWNWAGNMNDALESPYSDIHFIFRVYPKGQNPQSLLKKSI